VHTWHDATDAQVQTWLQGLGVTFPALNETSPYPILNSYDEGAGYVPHGYIIGRDMIIRREIPGSVSCDILEGYLKDVLYIRPPVDLEMIMDVSDTMNSPAPSNPLGPSKLELMHQAATIISDFMHDHGQVDDRMGLVWFTDDASEYATGSGQKLLSVQTYWSTLRSQILAHTTGICTAMGAGMQKAFDTLSASTHARYAILCTDGMQNIDPKAAPVSGHYEIKDIGGGLCGAHSSVPSHPGVDIASYHAPVHTIGIGITATYAPLLQEIANSTGGFYRATDAPDLDLDLIYLIDLCNSLAGGSPSVVHHNAGKFEAKNCQVEEVFYINRSVRKMTVALSWQSVQHGSLTFWLHAPNDALLDLHVEMKQFESYCLATVYLPKEQDGQKLPYVGKWRMVIRGESPSGTIGYHAIVVAEDHELKYHIDYPREVYKVGMLLPIHVNLALNEQPILKVNEVVLEASHLAQPLEQLVGKFELPLRKPASKLHTTARTQDPVFQKLQAMQLDPKWRKQLEVVRTRYSLSQGNLECKQSGKELVVQFPLKQTGLNSFKVLIRYETEKEGPIYRIEYISVHVA
jgi:hypothetical protein